MKTSSNRQKRDRYAETLSYNDDQIEDSEAAIRRHLELRPTNWSEQILHPDRRPCPSWCWVGQSEGTYQHALESQNPAVAVHTQDGSPVVMASCYRGWDTTDGVHTASIEPHLQQSGQAPVRITVGLRQGSATRGRKTFDYAEVLKLNLDDARELIIALQHLVEVADAG